MKLWPFQEAIIDSVESEYARGITKPLVVSPTGSGKGTMAVEMAARCGGRVLFVTPGREISVDIRSRMKLRGVHESQVDVMTIQQLASRKPRASYELVVADEAHHFAENSWSEAVSRLSFPRMVGFTATPQRGDGRPLGTMFDGVVMAPSTVELIRLGYLCDVDVFASARPSAGNLALDPVRTVLSECSTGRTFLFSSSASEADEHAASLDGLGLRSASITCRTPSGKRARIISAFCSGEIRVIANFATMTEGVNVAAADNAVIARACAHAGLFVQMTGRVLRKDGAKRSRIIDLAGNVEMHGNPLGAMTASLHGNAIRLGEAKLHAPGAPPRDDQTGSDAAWRRLCGIDGLPVVKVIASDGVGIGESVSLRAVDFVSNRIEKLARERGFSAEWQRRAKGVVDAIL